MYDLSERNKTFQDEFIEKNGVLAVILLSVILSSSRITSCDVSMISIYRLRMPDDGG